MAKAWRDGRREESGDGVGSWQGVFLVLLEEGPGRAECLASG